MTRTLAASPPLPRNERIVASSRAMRERRIRVEAVSVTSGMFATSRQARTPARSALTRNDRPLPSPTIARRSRGSSARVYHSVPVASPTGSDSNVSRSRVSVVPWVVRSGPWVVPDQPGRPWGRHRRGAPRRGGSGRWSGRWRGPGGRLRQPMALGRRDAVDGRIAGVRDEWHAEAGVELDPVQGGALVIDRPRRCRATSPRPRSSAPAGRRGRSA